MSKCYCDTHRGTPTQDGCRPVDRRTPGALYCGGVCNIRPLSPLETMTAGTKDRLELAALESRVDELIKTVESLAHENESLRHQQATLAAERAALVEKTEQARSRVEAMIARLKAMETRS